MHNIYLGLSAGINVTNYVNMIKGIESDPEKEVKSLLSQMDMYQKHQLMLGFESNVDVLKYMDPRYDWKQMRQIRYGLEKGLNVSIYADPKYDKYQMDAIRRGMESGIDVSKYADPVFNAFQMFELKSYGIRN